MPEDLHYEGWKAECLSKVVEWKYSVSHCNFFTPFKKHAPQFVESKDDARQVHGFDAQGRVLITEHVRRAQLPPRPGDAKLYRYRGEAAYYGGFYEERLKQYHKYVLRGGKIIEHHSLGGENMEAERVGVDYYTCDRGHPNKMRSEYATGKIYEATYDADANLTGHWRIKPNGERVSLEEKPLPKGVNLKTLTAQIRERLPKLIQKTVAAAKVKEPVYCLALAYDGEGNGVMPPILGIGIDSERQKWIKEHGKDARNFIWNPAEFTHYEKNHTQWEDDEFDQLCEWCNQFMAERDSEAPAIKLLNEVAAELATVDWRKQIKTTPDFVVYAVDFELGDLSKNLKKSVAPALLGKLKAAKLL